MNPTLKRTLCGLAVGAAVVAFFLYCPLKVVPVFLLAISLLVQLEFYQMARKYEPVTWFGLMLGAAWIIATAAFPGPVGFAGGMVGLCMGGVPIMFLLSCIVLFSPRYTKPIGTIAVTLAGFLYVPFLLSFFLRLVQLAGDPDVFLFSMPDTRVGLYTLLAVIALAKFSDTGGFAFGMAFGKHKMCPAIIRFPGSRAKVRMGRSLPSLEVLHMAARGACGNMLRARGDGGRPDREQVQARMRRKGLRHFHARRHGRLPRHARLYHLPAGTRLSR